jgi:hypothetical protein
MNDCGAIVLNDCAIYSQTYFGVINKSERKEEAGGSASAAGRFFASISGCTFSGSMWHISAGADISSVDRLALEAANRFEGNAEAVTGHHSEYTGGCIQPWRPNWLASATAALFLESL